MEFRVNQKVRVKQDTRNDGTCSGNCISCGSMVALKGDTGYVRKIGEFMYEPVIEVHFIETNKVIGFRKRELEIIEDYDPDAMTWTAVAAEA